MSICIFHFNLLVHCKEILLNTNLSTQSINLIILIAEFSKYILPSEWYLCEMQLVLNNLRILNNESVITSIQNDIT